MRIPIASESFAWRLTARGVSTNTALSAVTQTTFSSIAIGTATATRHVMVNVAAVDTAATGNTILNSGSGVTIGGVNANPQRTAVDTATDSLIICNASATVPTGTTASIVVKFTNTFSGDVMIDVYTIDFGVAATSTIGVDNTPGTDGFLYGSTLGNKAVAVGVALWEGTGLGPADFGAQDWDETAADNYGSLGSVATYSSCGLHFRRGEGGGEIGVTPTSFTPGDAGCGKFLSAHYT